MNLDKDGNVTGSGSGMSRSSQTVQPKDIISSNSSGNSNSSKEPNFPAKLHAILSSPKYQDIISWLPHGRSFRILRLKEFEETILPEYFRHGRYPSFTRQLNGWGFQRVNEGPEYNSHYHELFLRGRPELVKQMRRLTSKDMADRKKGEKTSTPTPDFFNMPPVPCSPGRATSEGNKKPMKASFDLSSDHFSTSLLARSERFVALQRELELLEERRMTILGHIRDLATTDGQLQHPRLAAFQQSMQPSLRENLYMQASMQQPSLLERNGGGSEKLTADAARRLYLQLLDQQQGRL
eukprot:scaffold2999_cov113-Cylindrotheca_fusiformis.AAC.9